MACRARARRVTDVRLLVLYASDLQARSVVAPGGITSNVRGYLGALPSSWDIEVWGASAAGAAEHAEPTLSVGGRTVRFRPLVTAASPAARRVPLSLKYAAGLAVAMRRVAVPKSHWDVIIAHRVEYLAALTLVCRRNKLPPSIAMIHGSSAFTMQAFGRVRGNAYLAAESIAVRSAAAVALVSGSSLPHYRARYAQHRDRFHWIPNGVDLVRFGDGHGHETDWRSRHGLAASDRVLVYHGRYDREKGVLRLLETFRTLLRDGEPWHLVCAGVGPLSTALVEAAEGWGKGRIQDLGHLSPNEVVRMLQAADLALLCSDFEGLSNGLLEALAAGLPVVATDAGDNLLVLQHLDSRLVTGMAPSQIADTVRWAWNNRDALAQRAPLVAARFSLEARVARIDGLMRSVLSGRCEGDDHE